MKNNYLNTLAKKDLILLYDISYPTLRRWLRRAGLHQFIGRKKLNYHELILIFNHLGRPLLARTATQRLKDIYHKMYNILSPEEAFKEIHQKEAPKIKQDQKEDSPDEIDHPAVLSSLISSRSKAPIAIWDALTRLRSIAIKLLGAKARKKAKKKTASTVLRLKKRKRLGKQYRRAA